MCIRCSLSRDEQICKNCDEGEVADVGHFLFHCAWVADRGLGDKANGEVDGRNCGRVA